MSAPNGWIGVDLDGTLAEYLGWKGVAHIGQPIAPMVKRVKKWLAEGKEVRIFTARVSPQAVSLNDSHQALVRDPIREWCVKHIGQELEITHEKDMDMVQLWDDRCVQIIPNTGLRADGQK